LLYPVYELAVMSAKHRLSRRNAIEVTELSDEPLMGTSKNSDLGEFVRI